MSYDGHFVLIYSHTIVDVRKREEAVTLNKMKLT